MKNMGSSTALLTIGNTVVDVKRQAKETPIAENVSEATAMAPIISTVSRIVRGTPARGAKGSRTSPCASAWSAPAMILPSAIAGRGTGATSTALKKPICRSKTIVMAEKVAVKSMERPMVPGKMNRL